MNPILQAGLLMLLKLIEPFLGKLFDMAFDRIEEWAKGKEAAGEAKPTGDEKLTEAAKIVARNTGLDLETAKVLMQAKVRQRSKEVRNVGKTARG